MTEKQDPKDPPKPKPLAHLEAKRAKNLRDNLARRKAQARARKESTSPPVGEVAECNEAGEG